MFRDTLGSHRFQTRGCGPAWACCRWFDASQHEAELTSCFQTAQAPIPKNPSILEGFQDPSFYPFPLISSGIDIHACVCVKKTYFSIYTHIAIHIDSYPSIFFTNSKKYMGQVYATASQLGSLGGVSVEAQFFGVRPSSGDTVAVRYSQGVVE